MSHVIDALARLLLGAKPRFVVYGGTTLCRTDLLDQRVSEDIDLHTDDWPALVELLHHELTNRLRRESPVSNGKESTAGGPSPPTPSDTRTDQAFRSSIRRQAVTTELRRAINERTIDVHYQPTVDLITGRAVGAEALVHWTHPTLGAVNPDEFIPIAEHTGLIRPLTVFVLESALAQCARWRKLAPTMIVSVNLSARSLVDVEVPEMVEGLLCRAGLAPEALVLEITESTVMGEPQRIAAIHPQFRQLGDGLSLDGFGTGQASLAQLKWLPVNELKIDRSFVTTMASDRTDACIVAASVALAQSLGLRAVAEGVEDEAVWARLIEVGCDDAQGFFVSVPLPADELAQWLRNRHHVPACSVSGAVHVVV